MNHNNNIVTKLFGDALEFTWDVFTWIYMIWVYILVALIFSTSITAIPVLGVDVKVLSFWENISIIVYSLYAYSWWGYFVFAFAGAFALALTTYTMIFNWFFGLFK